MTGTDADRYYFRSFALLGLGAAGLLARRRRQAA
jgi:MYXO-CTERM domain-containing protein